MSAAHRDYHSGESSAYQGAADHHDDDSGDPSAFQWAADHHDDDSGDPSAFQGAADHHDDDDDHDEAISCRALRIDLCMNLEGLSYVTVLRLSLCTISFARARPSALCSCSK